MKKMMKRVVLLILSMTLLLSCTACQKKKENFLEKYGPNFREDMQHANQDYLYGMCHLAWSNQKWRGIDQSKSMELIANMGSKSIRNWMHTYWLMNSPTEMKQNEVTFMKEIIAEAQKYDMQIIGMNHGNFHDVTAPNGGDQTAKPRRNRQEGSYYQQWLKDYETTWYTLVSAFPEITYWEIDNECNNVVFMPCLDGGTFTLRQMAEIYTDMMYYASLGIHRANPNAVSVMGGIIPESAASFLQSIYNNIKSGEFGSTYPDDFFQIAAWHPYATPFNVESFVENNKKIYQVILDNEGKDKKVFFTEMGWSNYHVSDEVKTEYLEQAYTAAKEQLPFVESIHYFQLFDDLSASWGNAQETKFGLIYDPVNKDNVDTSYRMGQPKGAAIRYQELAGGTGSLSVMEKA